MRPGAKNGSSMRRISVWYGGSLEIGGTTMPKSAIEPYCATSGLRELNVSVSCAMATMSSCRVGTHMPRNASEWATGQLLAQLVPHRERVRRRTRRCSG